MKHVLIFLLFVISASTKAQDKIMADSGEYKKNFLVFGGSYLYNIYHGRRTNEFAASSQSPSSIGPTKYTKYEYINTSGCRLNGAFRHFFTKNISIQNGIRIDYKINKNIHQDSLKNDNNSPLKSRKESEYIVDYSFYFNYRIKRITLSSGMSFPVIMYKYSSELYQDKSIKRYYYGFEFKEYYEFYLSANLQYQPFTKTNLAINLGIDISHELIFNKYPRGYLILLNSGITWFFEKKNNQKKIKDD